MTDITQLKRALVARVLDSNGMAPQELRRAAFDDAGVDEPMGTLIEKVVYHEHGDRRGRRGCPRLRTQ